jgi:hypothetical protein
MRFSVLTAVNMSMLVYWVVTPCGLVGRYKRFGGTYCFHLLDAVSTQKTTIDNIWTVTGESV